jgi:hypothetical protein
MGPVGVQKVMTAVMLTLPLGVTVQDCVALPPAAVVAVAVKELETRDSACVGVQVMVLAERVAPAGAAVSANVMAVEPETVAASS